MISRNRQVLIAAAAAVAVVIFPAAAHAATIFYKGKGIDDPTVRVSFELKGPADSHGLIKFGQAKVEDFELDGVKTTITCTGVAPTTTDTNYIFNDIDVQGDGDFKGVDDLFAGPNTEGKKKVKGQFKGGEQAAQGSFKARGAVSDPSGTSCVYETDKIHWKAHGVDS